MRYTFPFLSISFMIFALIGCSVIENDEQIVNTDPAFPEFYIGGDDLGQSDAGTKVTGALGRDDFFTWTYNDRVAIYPGLDIQVEYVYEGETGATKGALKAIAGGDYTFGGDPINYSVAVLPYQKDRISLNGDTLYMDFPQVQTYSPEELSDGQFYMVDVVDREERNLFFKSIGSYVVLTLNNPSELDQPVKGITMKSVSGKPLWGKFYIILEENTDDPIDYTAKYSSGGNSSIKLDMSGEEGGYITIPPGESRDFYFFIPSQDYTSAYSNSIQFSMSYPNGMSSFTKNGALVAERNGIYFYEFDYAPVSPPEEPESYVEQLLRRYDKDGDGVLSDEEAEAVTYLLVQEIVDFDPAEPGFELERFRNITELQFYQVKFKSESPMLDLSPFESLTSVELWDVEGLTHVKFNSAANSALTNLDISDCPQLSSVDFSRAKNLEYIEVKGTSIENPDFSYNTKVKEFEYSSNYKTLKVDLRAMKELEELECSYNGNAMSEIKLPRSKALHSLDLSGLYNALEGELDLSYYTKLRGEIGLYNSKLTNIVLPKPDHNDDLSLDVSSSSIRKLDLSNIAGNIVSLRANGCQNLESINLEGCNGLSSIRAQNNPLLKSLDITECSDSNVTLYLYSCPSCETLTLREGQLGYGNVDEHIEWIYEQ